MKDLKYIIVFLLVGSLAAAGTITVWGNSDVLTASALNANFAHIHNTMVGGHGPRLVDGDVASGASIATTKLAGAAKIAKCWGTWSCSPSVCTALDSSNATLTYSAVGIYSLSCPGMTWPAVVVATTRANVGGKIICETSGGTVGASAVAMFCNKLVSAGAGADVTGTAIDGVYSFAVFDN